MIKKTLPLGSTGHLLHKATLPRRGFSYTETNTQRHPKSEDKDTCPDFKNRRYTQEKKMLNEMKASDIPDARSLKKEKMF